MSLWLEYITLRGESLLYIDFKRFMGERLPLSFLIKLLLGDGA